MTTAQKATPATATTTDTPAGRRVHWAVAPAVGLGAGLLVSAAVATAMGGDRDRYLRYAAFAAVVAVVLAVTALHRRLVTRRGGDTKGGPTR